MISEASVPEDTVVIPGILIAEMGQDAFSAMITQVQMAVEAQTGIRWQWIDDLNRECFTLRQKSTTRARSL